MITDSLVRPRSILALVSCRSYCITGSWMLEALLCSRICTGLLLILSTGFEAWDDGLLERILSVLNCKIILLIDVWQTALIQTILILFNCKMIQKYMHACNIAHKYWNVHLYQMFWIIREKVAWNVVCKRLICLSVIIMLLMGREK